MRYVLEKYGLFPGSPASDGISFRILHLAPEQATFNYMRQCHATYLTADAQPERYPGASCLKLKLPGDFRIFPDGYFDLIIHNHVLEHIPGDYRIHMLEFFRILAPGGHMVFTVPFTSKSPTVQGGEYLQSDAERLEKFGQKDHLKMFGYDFPAFFSCLKGSFTQEILPPKEAKEFNAGDKVYVLNRQEE